MTGIAIVGRGVMARAHAQAWSELGLGDHILYVSTLTGGAPLAHATRARFEPDLDVVFADPLVTIVSVCTPTVTHAGIALRALRAGKSVLLEKPIALTLADAMAIQDAARQSPGVLMVAHVVRFFDGYRSIREAVQSGGLGDILSARAGRFSSKPRPSTWWHDESKSGGVVVDFSIHDFDQLNLFLGRPLAVTARRGRSDGPIEAMVDYEGGGVGHVVGFMGMPAGFTFASTLDLVGSAGLATHGYSGPLDSGPLDSGPLDSGPLDSGPLDSGPLGCGTLSAAPDTVRVQTVDGVTEQVIAKHNPYRLQAQYFLECVRADTMPEFCPVDAAVLALAVALAARESLQTGSPVAVTV